MIRAGVGLLVAALGVMPVSAQQVASLGPEVKAQPAREARLGYVAHSWRRQSAAEAAGTATGSGTLSGFELLARLDGLGVLVRRSTGSLEGTGHGLGGDYLSQEARLMFGGRVVMLEGGYVERTSSNLSTETTTRMWRLGLRSQWDIGGSGVVAMIGGGAFLARPELDGSAEFKLGGHDLEAQVLVQAPRGLPLYLLAGWRHERFDDLDAATPRFEEASGPYLGIGMRVTPQAVLRE